MRQTMKRDAYTMQHVLDTSLDLLLNESTSLSLTQPQGNALAEEQERQHSWVVPRFTKDSMAYGALSENKESGDQAYESLLNNLLGIDDTSDVNDFTSQNPEIYQLLRRLTYGAFFCSLSAHKRAQRTSDFRLVFEFVMAWLFRLLNSTCWVLPIVLLSLWAWRSKVPRPFWELLCRWRLLYDKSTTDMIASDLGNRVLRYPQSGSRKESLSVMDNCLVRFDTSFKGVREDGDGSQVCYMVTGARQQYRLREQNRNHCRLFQASR